MALNVQVLTVLDLCFAVVGLIILRRIFGPKSLPLPPGPKGLPLIGNILDMPTEKEWETFAQWGDAFGDICSVTVLGQPLIILSSAKVAVDLLDKRSSIYSDRPVLQMGGELVGWKNTLVLLQYGDRFKRFRKLFHNLIGSHATMRQYFPAQELEAKKFLRKVLAEPDDLQAHVRRLAGAVVLRISHGYEVQEHKDDPFVTLANSATEQFSLATSTGQFMVDCIPALRHVPDWVPGADFKRKAKQWAATLIELVEQPHNFVKQQMLAGTASISFTSSMLERAADTTVSAIYAFFLAMTLYPEVARKAQAEIDAVVGNDRLPTFADREHLPYVDAVVKEVFRWNVVTPLAVPHRATQDDFYDGYFIPKGSLLIPNLWFVMHDPACLTHYAHIPAAGNSRTIRVYIMIRSSSSPSGFLLIFLQQKGWGDRWNPILEKRVSGLEGGMHLADTTVFACCVTSLAILDIDKCNENGVVIEPVNDQTSGTISHPKPFKCSIKPRSPKAVALVQSSDEQF
ncbi:hypothetical protein HHX47_DHR5000291 [Lentinula edodes]|nr:hypothetical protein HHX47_DHR5000291 [Lentinula edodes]